MPDWQRQSGQYVNVTTRQGKKMRLIDNDDCSRHSRDDPEAVSPMRWMRYALHSFAKLAVEYLDSAMHEIC